MWWKSNVEINSHGTRVYKLKFLCSLYLSSVHLLPPRVLLLPLFFFIPHPWVFLFLCLLLPRGSSLLVVLLSSSNSLDRGFFFFKFFKAPMGSSFFFKFFKLWVLLSSSNSSYLILQILLWNLSLRDLNSTWQKSPY